MKIEDLRSLLEAYGAGVRAGVITPCLQDENFFRERLTLESAPEEVIQDWKNSAGVRRPITLGKPSESSEVDEVEPVENLEE